METTLKVLEKLEMVKGGGARAGWLKYDSGIGRLRCSFRDNVYVG